MKYTGKERRRFKRVDTLLHVMVRVHSDNWDEIVSRTNGTVLNLSRDSLLLKTDDDVVEGNRISLLIHSQKRKTKYSIRGIVTQKRKHTSIVMITDCSPPDIVITDFQVDDMDRELALATGEARL